MDQDSPTEQAVRFQIFRGSSARPCDLMTYEPSSGATDETTESPDTDALEGLDEGHDLNVLFDMPGLSLVRVWFKSGYPLPRHSHNVDCLYYIVGGSLRMGGEVLRMGDGFFVGNGVPYTYTPGPEGVHLLEFRTANAFDIKVLGSAKVSHRKSVEVIKAQQGAWAKELQPPL